MAANVLVLTGDGINCERDCRFAFEAANAKAKIVHINDLLESPKHLSNYQILCLPGGFSFGDDLGSGQVLALKLQYALGEHFREFVQGQTAVIGICNGFQALVKLGLLPNPFEPRTVALARNRQGHFQDRWVDLQLDSRSPCWWTKNIPQQNFSLPIRHGEGRIVLSDDSLLAKLQSNGQVPLTYAHDVNGSVGRIAGLCDPSGRIFGLMPHPEAALFQRMLPQTIERSHRADVGPGFHFFRSCLSHF